MKRLLLILFAAVAFGCDSGQSSDRAERSDVEESVPFDETEQDNSIHSDSTTSGGMNRQNQYDTLQ